jgi:hypothetical protein
MSKRLALAGSALAVVVMLVGLTACEKRVQAQEAIAPQPVQATAPAAGAEKKVAEVPIYERQIAPLTADQCAQCHNSIFQNIKEQGGRHQIDCVRCHVVFHAYNPLRQNFAELMPKCEACHKDAAGGPFHGSDPAVTDCLSCHADPHRPLTIPMSGVETACAKCHSAEAGEVAANPSAHAEAVACSDCHSGQHGHIPQCGDCHANHSPQVTLDSPTCMGCHPVHSPTRISYSDSTNSLICAGCHENVYADLTAKETKHTAVACANCHPSHKAIEPCSTCHGEPHSAALMKDMSCGGCHGKAHKLAAD